MKKENLNIGDIVTLKVKAPRCKHNPNYKIMKILRTNCIALNMGTYVDVLIKINNINPKK
tara:strand:+ start:255 stop:434 length:180 start_codon:yes stop_codon:yes gene_type:complete